MIKTTNEELNTALYEKMFAEQEEFKSELLGMSPAEVLDRAYAYYQREDILLCAEYHDFSDKQCESLLKLDKPLEHIFHTWENWETDHMECIRDCFESSANAIIRAELNRSER